MSIRILFFAGLLLLGSLAHAQISGQGVQERAKDKANQRVDRKVDETIDRGLDRLEEGVGSLFKKKPKKDKRKGQGQDEGSAEAEAEATPDQDLSAIMGMLGGGNVSLPEDYVFAGSALIHMVFRSPDGEMRMDGEYFFHESGAYFGSKTLAISSGGEDVPEAAGMMSIMQGDEMIMFLDQGGSKMAMVYDLSGLPAEAEEGPQPKVSKTGRSKSILGYTCDEYLIEDEELSLYAWLTRGFPDGLRPLFDGMKGFSSRQAQQQGQNPMQMKGVQEGFPLEMSGRNGDGDYEWRVVELKPTQQSRFSTAGYQAMKLPAGMGN